MTQIVLRFLKSAVRDLNHSSFNSLHLWSMFILHLYSHFFFFFLQMNFRRNLKVTWMRFPINLLSYEQATPKQYNFPLGCEACPPYYAIDFHNNITSSPGSLRGVVSVLYTMAFSPWVLRHRSLAQRNLTAVFLNNFIIRTESEVSLRIEKIWGYLDPVTIVKVMYSDAQHLPSFRMWV